MALAPRLLAVTVSLWIARPADAGICNTLDLEFLPGARATNLYGLQIVAWLERPDGTFVETVFITSQTGSHGIGNRPGRFDFNSAPGWPYGRRDTVFPIWSHRHGLMWDQLVFQNGEDSNLSHPFDQSSPEQHFCRPLLPTEDDFDAHSCASTVYTDKGTPGTSRSLYPPRNDVKRTDKDDPIVAMFDVLNPFDGVSQATPAAGSLAAVSYPIPATLPPGDYVLWVEVAREFDFNDTYNPTSYPPPPNLPFGNYGVPARGQPSIVYTLPIRYEAGGEHTAQTTDYVGYGDPDGLDGMVRTPDPTISVGVPGSGASRLQLISRSGETYRIRAAARSQTDNAAPAAASDLQLVTTTTSRATLAFTAPGDDGASGRARRYEIRYLAGDGFDFDRAMAGPVVSPAPGGTIQTVALDGLLPETEYTVGIRAIDDCGNSGELATLTFTTAERGYGGTVDACFIATAAYGSPMAGDVGLLRRFRDAMLRHSPLGELAVAGYYTFGPALAGTVGESDLLRATARDILAPIVARVRGAAVSPP